MAGLARDMIFLGVAGAVAAVLVWLVRRSSRPRWRDTAGWRGIVRRADTVLVRYH